MTGEVGTAFQMYSDSRAGSGIDGSRVLLNSHSLVTTVRCALSVADDCGVPQPRPATRHDSEEPRAVQGFLAAGWQFF